MPTVSPDDPAASGPSSTPGGGPSRYGPPLVRRTIVADELLDPAERQRLGFPAGESEPLPVVIELNLRHHEGLTGATRRFLALYQGLPERLDPEPELVAETYYRCRLSVKQVRALVAADMVDTDPARTALYRIWPDFPVNPLIDLSCSTVKADAGRRSYVAGGLAARHVGARGVELRVVERVVDPNQPGLPRLHERKLDPGALAGMAPECKLVSLKALDDNGGGSSMNVVRALEYVRKELNGSGKLLRVQGVNLSVGYEFDAKWFACGQSPICNEVDRLVRSGVVVVVAAGNTGYGSLSSFQRQTDVGLTMTINDPGNAELAVTVGATHRDMPHTYGVSYFSSKGPTGDGRAKPDLVAPGERITSCAAGRALATVGEASGKAVYVEDSGTSMAAPHVSGAIAAFLSIRREFIGQPEQIKQIFSSSATSLGRERYFEGHGLVDLMRAIQSI